MVGTVPKQQRQEFTHRAVFNVLVLCPGIAVAANQIRQQSWLRLRGRQSDK